MWHRSWAEFRRFALREWSTWLGFVLVAVALVSIFVFDSSVLAEYEKRVGHAGPIVLGILGLIGILKRDRPRGKREE